MTSSRPSTLPRAAAFDVAILREMYPARGVEISGIDPRLNASRIARRLGTSRARVAARLRAWGETGFVQRYDVWPNPTLFGLTGFSLDVRVAERSEKSDVIARIGLVAGAVAGLDLTGDWIASTFLLPAGEDGNRTAALVRSLTGVAETGVPVAWAPSEATRPLTPLELRIVRVLRQYPTESLAEIARHVGVSSRTITARYGKLLDDRAVWFIPVFDFRALAEPVVSLSVELASGAERAAFARALRRQFPNSIEFLRAPFGPVLPDHVGGYFVIAESAARVEDVEAWVHRAPGVRSHEAATLIRVLTFPETIDRLIAAGASPAGAPRIK
jgi:DNA-binding Lrp family transcriptional regulator